MTVRRPARAASGSRPRTVAARPGHASGTPPRTAQILGRAMAFLAPTGFITGVAYYFGYVSARAYYGYFGVSLSALDLPPSQFFIQATDTAFRPLAIGALLGMAALVLHLVLSTLDLARYPRAVRAGLIVGGAAVALLTGIGLVGLVTGRGGEWSAAALATAAVLTEYVIWLGLSTRAAGAGLARMARSHVELRHGLLFAILAISVFWATTNLAQARGSELASLTDRTLFVRQQAVVYSASPLHLEGTGIAVETLGGDGEGSTYRYTGLRPLVFAHDRWFLLPSGWSRTSGDSVVILPESPGALRVELVPGIVARL